MLHELHFPRQVVMILCVTCAFFSLYFCVLEILNWCLQSSAVSFYRGMKSFNIQIFEFKKKNHANQYQDMTTQIMTWFKDKFCCLRSLGESITEVYFLVVCTVSH
jgi:hypothetical protein